MRFPRVKAEGQSFYHCISRAVEGRFIFNSSAGSCLEAEKFLSLMRRLEAFSGVRVLTYALMANHFHLLCEVPEPKPLSESEVLERIADGYGPQRVAALREQLVRCAEQPDAASKNNAPAFELAKAQEVVEQEKGELSLQERLRCRIRYFSDGVILGSRCFVEAHCQRLKQKIAYKRKSGPTALKILGPAALWVFRNLRVRTFG
jgi:hypothetical protein